MTKCVFSMHNYSTWGSRIPVIKLHLHRPQCPGQEVTLLTSSKRKGTRFAEGPDPRSGFCVRCAPLGLMDPALDVSSIIRTIIAIL